MPAIEQTPQDTLVANNDFKLCFCYPSVTRRENLEKIVLKILPRLSHYDVNKRFVVSLFQMPQTMASVWTKCLSPSSRDRSRTLPLLWARRQCSVATSRIWAPTRWVPETYKAPFRFQLGNLVSYLPTQVQHTIEKLSRFRSVLCFAIKFIAGDDSSGFGGCSKPRSCIFWFVSLRVVRNRELLPRVKQRRFTIDEWWCTMRVYK